MKTRGGGEISLKQGFLALAVMFLAVTMAGAQTFRGTILGTVTDVTGAAVPGATVTIRNTETGLLRTTESQADGSYAVPELPIGTYDVTVEKTGFQTSVTKAVPVTVAAEKRVDAALKPGQVRVDGQHDENQDHDLDDRDDEERVLGQEVAHGLACASGKDCSIEQKRPSVPLVKRLSFAERIN